MVRVGDRVRVRPDMTRWLCMVRVGDRWVWLGLGQT